MHSLLQATVLFGALKLDMKWAAKAQQLKIDCNTAHFLCTSVSTVYGQQLDGELTQCPSPPPVIWTHANIAQASLLKVEP